MRHGPAEVRSSGKNDLERPLTEAGHSQTRAASRGLKRLGIAPRLVLTSPARRALETAQIAVSELDIFEALTTAEELLPGAEPEKILKLIADQRNDLLLVGHEPDFGKLAALLVGGGMPALEMSKAGVAALSFVSTPAPGAAKLLWLLRRKQLRRIGA